MRLLINLFVIYLTFRNHIDINYNYASLHNTTNNVQLGDRERMQIVTCMQFQNLQILDNNVQLATIMEIWHSI